MLWMACKVHTCSGTHLTQHSAFILYNVFPCQTVQIWYEKAGHVCSNIHLLICETIHVRCRIPYQTTCTCFTEVHNVNMQLSGGFFQVHFSSTMTVVLNGKRTWKISILALDYLMRQQQPSAENHSHYFKFCPMVIAQIWKQYGKLLALADM